MKTAFRDGDLVLHLLDPRPRRPFTFDSHWDAASGMAVAVSGSKTYRLMFLADPSEEAVREEEVSVAVLQAWIANNLKG